MYDWLRHRDDVRGYLAINVLISCEFPLHIWMNKEDTHQWLHNYPFVLLICAVVALRNRGRFVFGVVVGGLLHVSLDAIVHDDEMPFLFVAWNPWFGLLNRPQTEGLCVALGRVGLADGMCRWIVRCRALEAGTPDAE